MVSIYDMDKFKQKEMNKITLIIIFLRQTPLKKTVDRRGNKLRKPKTQNIRKPFISKESKKN